MSTGQIAQRPYSSFRAKYGINSSPVLGSRMISYTKQRNPMEAVSATAVPVTPINGTPNRKAADQTTTDEKINQINKTKTYRNGNSSTPAQSYTKSTSSSNVKTIPSWENRTFYSSTRSTKSSNLMETNKLVRSSKNACSLHSSNSANSSSSTGTSVESIVPKYGPSGNGSSSFYPSNGLPNGHQQSAKNINTFNGSQKRAYNTNKMSKENVPHLYANKKTYSSTTTPLTASGKHAAGDALTAAAPRKYNAKENMHAFSSKFPQGMPFEDEFYKVRSYSVTSDASKYSSYSNYDNNALPFEDEFLRKPSNEPLYVDFSKSIPVTVNKGNNHSHNSNKLSGSTASSRPHFHQYHHNKHQHNIINNDYENFFCKFESVTKGSNSNNNNYKNSVCDAQNKVNATRGGDQPVVYVAVASWVPKCNQQQYHTNLLEPLTKGQVYVYNFYIFSLN